MEALRKKHTLSQCIPIYGKDNEVNSSSLAVRGS